RRCVFSGARVFCPVLRRSACFSPPAGAARPFLRLRHLAGLLDALARRLVPERLGRAALARPESLGRRRRPTDHEPGSAGSRRSHPATPDTMVQLLSLLGRIGGGFEVQGRKVRRTAVLICIAAALAVPAAAHPPLERIPERGAPALYRTKLDNGLTAVIDSRPGRRTVYCEIGVRVGSRDEDLELAGISHLL